MVILFIIYILVKILQERKIKSKEISNKVKYGCILHNGTKGFAKEGKKKQKNRRPKGSNYQPLVTHTPSVLFTWSYHHGSAAYVKGTHFWLYIKIISEVGMAYRSEFCARLHVRFSFGLTAVFRLKTELTEGLSVCYFTNCNCNHKL
jgi:hypothetical protein